MGLLLLTSKTDDIEDEIESVKEMVIRRNTYLQCQGILVKLRNKQNLVVNLLAEISKECKMRAFY